MRETKERTRDRKKQIRKHITNIKSFLFQAGGNVELLPDLQETDSVYRSSDFYPVSTFAAENDCVMVSLRAGVLAKQESTEAVKEFMSQNPNVFLNAFSQVGLFFQNLT